MAKMAVADIIIPTEFEKYAIERTAELSRFGESGIVEMAGEFDELAAGGGDEPQKDESNCSRQFPTLELHFSSQNSKSAFRPLFMRFSCAF
jgi:hypothetical protein